MRIADAVALTLLIRDREPQLFEPAALGLHALMCRELAGLSAEEAQLALSTLLALDGPGRPAATHALAELLEARGEAEAVGWLEAGPQ